MSGALATILAAAIAAAISFIAAIISFASAKGVAKETIQAKLDELKQGQITEILRQRIDRYPSLWKLCQEIIAVPSLAESPPATGWEINLSRALEAWHIENGLFLSQDCYRGLWQMRKVARELSADPTSGTAALVHLKELNIIWKQGFIDDNGARKPGLATLLKNDLGSYGHAALSGVWRQVL